MPTMLQRLQHHTKPLIWAILVLMTMFPLSQHALAGMVVCIGFDGHVEVENGWTGDCATPEQVRAHEHHAFLETVRELEQEEDDCGECVDIPLLTSLSENRVVTLNPVAPVVPSIYDALLALIVPARTPAPSAAELGYDVRPSEPLLALRSVVLLT